MKYEVDVTDYGLICCLKKSNSGHVPDFELVFVWHHVIYPVPSKLVIQSIQSHVIYPNKRRVSRQLRTVSCVSCHLSIPAQSDEVLWPSGGCQ